MDTEAFTPSGLAAHESAVVRDLFGEDVQNRLQNKSIVLYAGRLTDGKGVIPLAKFHSSLDRPDVHLLIVGGPSHTQYGDFMTDLRSVVNSSENIHMHPKRVAHDSIIELIDVATAVALLTSYSNEGTPKILQEALAMNTPCISTNVSGIRQAFSDVPGCLLIEPDDRRQYVDALNSAIQGKIAIDMEKVQKQFDISTNYQRVSEVYYN